MKRNTFILTLALLSAAVAWSGGPTAPPTGGSITGTVAVANGGTGAADAAGARSNLSVAASNTMSLASGTFATPANVHMLTLRGITAAAQGGSVTQNHNLTGSKIVGWTVQVLAEGVNWWPQEHSFNTGHQYSARVSDTNVAISNSAANSSQILSSQYVFVIWYID